MTGYHPKKRRETLTVRVEAHNPPPAFSADLVFVQGGTSSSVSPASENHLAQLTSVVTTSGTHYSPHHLSNTFGASDQIDNTGLLVDPSDYHSQVFIGGTVSQDSEPHFSSQRSEATFHVNLTQTSQPDNLSNSATQLDSHPPQTELPSISELANNSSPIDTFDLHHSTSSNQTLTTQPQIEYSYSQEYRDQYTPHIITSSSPDFEENSIVAHQQECKKEELTETSCGGNSSNSGSVIVVSYTPLTVKGEQASPEKRLPYRRYSSPQQRLLYTKINNSSSSDIKTCKPPELVSDSDNESDSEMSLNKRHRTSGRRQMRVVPTMEDKENAPLINGTSHLANVQLILLPGEKTLGFSVSGGDGDPVCVDYITGGMSTNTWCV